MKIMKVKGEWTELQIKCNSKDSKRDHIASAVVGIQGETIIRKLYNILYTQPELSVAAVFDKIATNSYRIIEDDGVLEKIYMDFYTVILFKDFSFLQYHFFFSEPEICSDNIFEFIDCKKHEEYDDDHVVNRFVKAVQTRFGFEHTMWRFGTDPFTGKMRTDAAWLEQKAKTSNG